jgi:hypothetical protein
MKKSVLALALAFGVTTAFAQDLTSKKGEPILPEAGDWGIGIDADPFFTYAQGIFGKTGTTSTPQWNFFNGAVANQAIMGRYFADEKTVYRGAIRLGFGSQTGHNYVTDDLNTSATPAYKDDSKKTSYSGIGLSAGIEKRKGKTRLQGYYGGELGIWFGGSKDKYTYGNALSTQNPSATSTTWSGTTPVGSSSVSSRVTDAKAGSTMAIGLRGFIGAEYFILPKMSIGGEFGWGLWFQSTGEGSTTTESFAGGSVTSNTVKTGKSSKFHVDTDGYNSVFGPSGTLRFNMYF